MSNNNYIITSDKTADAFNKMIAVTENDFTKVLNDFVTSRSQELYIEEIDEDGGIFGNVKDTIVWFYAGPDNDYITFYIYVDELRIRTTVASVKKIEEVVDVFTNVLLTATTTVERIACKMGKVCDMLTK